MTMHEVPPSPATGFDPARLIADHQVGIWRFLRALGCEATLADDLTQETFLAVLERPFSEINRAATSSYLRTIARNLLISHHRRNGRYNLADNLDELVGEWSRWAGDDDGESAIEALRECLKALTPRARQALEQRFRDRTSRSAIAEGLGITEHGAKNLMQRAKQQLRACVEQRLK
jgi:RNA polymerase sigma-70 factor (ECF subfamily)